MDWNTFRKMNFENSTREDAVETKEIKSIEDLKMNNELPKELPKGYVLKKCEHCGQEFAVDEHYAKIKKYCGPNCRKEVEMKQKKEYSHNYYKKITMKKRQDKRLENKLANVEELSVVPVKAMNFFDVATMSIEIMRIAQSDKSNASKLSDIMNYIEKLLEK